MQVEERKEVLCWVKCIKTWLWYAEGMERKPIKLIGDWIREKRLKVELGNCSDLRIFKYEKAMDRKWSLTSIIKEGRY